MKKLPKLIVILGPTASGKSSLAIELARKYNGEIVSADSRQIYRGMDIGTGKVVFDCHPERPVKDPNTNTEKQRDSSLPQDDCKVQGIPHYMLDIVNPDEEFSLADFQKEATNRIKDIQLRGKTPFLVGGTGLYIQSIIDNLQIPKVKPNKKLRKELEKLSIEDLQKRFFACHPELDSGSHVGLSLRGEYSRRSNLRDCRTPLRSARNDKNIDLQNPRRLIRAIEIAETNLKSPLPPFSKGGNIERPIFDTLQIGIDIPREELYKKINERVDEMITEGLVEESEKLAKKYSWELPAMSGIGYKQMQDYFTKKISLQEATEFIKRDTRRYAKRQITWFKRDHTILWINNFKQAEKTLEIFLKTE